jgi:RNA polymerase sigma factor (sigma-70 family)
VFADLARKAAKLSDRTVLSGWLYRSAQFAASDVVRSERRRRAREWETQIMHEITGSDPRNETDWEKCRPVLDQVMGELADTDRDAIALRFLEERSFADIGRVLRLSEEAARKRVERALDKMHVLLARRGVRSTTAALALTLTGQAATSTPMGLAATITGAALAGTATGAVVSAGGVVVSFMSMSKMQVGMIAAVALAGVAGYVSQTRVNEELRRELAAGQEQQQEMAALRTENRGLADTLTEVEALRRDDAELKQLAEEVIVLKRQNEKTQRLNQSQDDQRRIQAELERVNREGTVLIQEYMALRVRSQDASGSEQSRAEATLAAQQKVEAIHAKQAEREVLMQSAQNAGVVLPVIRARPGPESSSGGTVTFRSSPPAGNTDANSLPAASSPSNEVSP